MLTPENVFLAVKPVDMRRGIDTLTQYVQDELKSSWHEGAAFVFTNKARSRIKVLRWPRAGDNAWSLTQDEFNWLITGVDWQQLNGHDLTKWVFREESGSAVTSL